MLNHNIPPRIACRLRWMEDSMPCRFFVTLTTTLIVSFVLDLARGRTDPEVESRHRALSEFLDKGQLTVDLFPPLSYFLRNSLPTWALVLVDHACRQAMVYMVCWNSAMDPSRPTHLGSSLQRWIWAMSNLSSFGFGMARTGQPTLQRGSSPLEVSSSLASCLILLAMMPKSTPAWVDQILVIIAGALGCNAIDWLLCYAVITARTLTRIVSDSPIMRSWSPSPRPFCAARVTCHLVLALIRAVCFPLLVMLSVYALLFPYSETSAGGNHNLHFLDSTSRRALYPLEPVTLASLGLSKHGKHIPKHALVPYLPLSLYIPSAGFLWAESHEPEAADQADTQTDVYFSDPFGMRYPWALEEPDPTGEQLDQDQLEFVQSHVWPGALVYLRSRIDHRYLGTAKDQNSTSSDEILGPDEQDGSFQRFWVGVHAKPSSPCVWILEHDAERDAGFRLYNPHQECYLATTFRTYGLTTSDGNTVENHIHRAHEASCTRAVSKPASTIWVIEGAASWHRGGKNPCICYTDKEQTGNLVHGSDQTTSTPSLLEAWKSVSGKFQRGSSINNAHVSLFQWQRSYGGKLEMPPSPLSVSRLHHAWGVWFEGLTFGCFLATQTLYLLVRQRTGRKSGIDWHVISPAVFLCWGHVLFHNVFMYARPHGTEVASAMAIGGFWELLSKSLR